MKRIKQATKLVLTALLATVAVLSVLPVLATDESPAALHSASTTASAAPLPASASTTASAVSLPASAVPTTASSPVILSADEVDNEIANAPIAGSSFTKNFTIPPNFGWVKLSIENTSSETLTVRVTQSTVTGTQNMLFSVAPGATYTDSGTRPWAN